MKKIFIALLISIFLVYFLYKLEKNNLLESNQINTWPSTPYGFDYIDNWQKDLFYILRDNLKEGEVYFFEPKNYQYIFTIVKMLEYEPSNHCVTYQSREDTIGNIFAIKKKNICTKNEELLIEEKAKKIIDEIEKYSLDHDLNIIDKINLIPTYMYSHVKYDNTNYEKSSSLYGALIDGKANCVGQAKMVSFLLEKMGIYSIIYSHENAYTNGNGHQSNLVYIDGQYYIIDVPYKLFFSFYNFTENYVYDIPVPKIGNINNLKLK